MTDETPPTTVFYAATGGKSAPFYLTLGGIKSALKTSWAGRWRKDHETRGEPIPDYLAIPRAYRGTVVWVEIDPETGSPRE